MAVYRKNGTQNQYTKAYTNLRGIRATGEDGEVEYMENLYRDYHSSGGGFPESVPGYRLLTKLPYKINAIYPLGSSDTTKLIIHAGTSLYVVPTSAPSNFIKIADIGISESSAFRFGNYLYLLSGGKMFRISTSGLIQEVGDDKEVKPYSPIVYFDDEKYEQRNLLSNRARERIRVFSTERFAYGSKGIKYHIVDTVLRYCSVVGIDSEFSGALYIPGYTRIGTDEYKVVDIEDKAFAQNTSITEVHIGEGVERIGKFAFQKNTALTKLTTPRSLRIIDNAAFQDCTSLSEVYLSDGLEYAGIAVFNFCLSLKKMNYSLDETHFKAIENYDLIDNYELIYESENLSGRVAIPIHSEANSCQRVTIDQEEIEFETETENGKPCAVLLDTQTPWSLDGKTIEIELLLPNMFSRFDGTEGNEGQIEGKAAICGCRISEKFDGRIFLSGNINLPGSVFYSAVGVEGDGEPLYFGEYNYFNDSRGEADIISMMAVRDSLAIFKNKDDGQGSIIYHYGKDTEDDVVPRVYPISSVHSQLVACGASRNFFDDPVFISPLGLCGIEHRQLEYDRSISVRSENVNYYLLSEDLKNAEIVEWEGYLCISVGGNMYLADSRDISKNRLGKIQYEWYMIRGVGHYDNAMPVYRYSLSNSDALSEHPNLDRKVEGIVFSSILTDKDGENSLMYFTMEQGKRFAVAPTEETKGGIFKEGRCFTSDDGIHLYFTASDGYLYTFNNDMRGIAPERIRESFDFDEDEYSSVMKHKIHPDFYDFGGRSVRYALRTRADNCTSPHLSKDTVKGSLVVKLKNFGRTSLTLEVGTDRSGYKEIVEFSPSDIDFYDIDFSGFTFALADSYTLPFGEKEKNWIEKSISLYTENFRSPIGVETVAFRYRLRGKIKKR